MRQPGVFRLGHQDERLSDALVGDEIQKWRLLQLSGEALTESTIKDGFTSGVGKVSEDDGIFVSEFGGSAGMPQIDSRGESGEDDNCEGDDKASV